MKTVKTKIEYISAEAVNMAINSIEGELIEFSLDEYELKRFNLCIDFLEKTEGATINLEVKSYQLKGVELESYIHFSKYGQRFMLCDDYGSEIIVSEALEL